MSAAECRTVQKNQYFPLVALAFVFGALARGDLGVVRETAHLGVDGVCFEGGDIAGAQ